MPRDERRRRGRRERSLNYRSLPPTRPQSRHRARSRSRIYCRRRSRYCSTSCRRAFHCSRDDGSRTAILIHAAHQDLSCFNCHANAWTSVETADVLSPDIDSSNVLTAAVRMKSNVQSCVDCHSKTDSKSSAIAPDDCTACHVYHDRTKQDVDDRNLREAHRSMVMAAPTTLPRREIADLKQNLIWNVAGNLAANFCPLSRRTRWERVGGKGTSQASNADSLTKRPSPRPSPMSTRARGQA